MTAKQGTGWLFVHSVTSGMYH